MTNLDKQPQPTAPQELADDIASLYGTRLLVPEDVDRAVLAHAHKRLTRTKRYRKIAWAGAAAAAACIIIAIGVTPGLRRGARAPGAPAIAFTREDIDRDGQVDILDAFALARRLEHAGETPDTQFDINGDGVVDQLDVDSIAEVAVRLDGGRM